LLQSFPRRHATPPNGFIFPEELPMTAVSRGIVIAVPPARARAVARAVAAHLLAHADHDEDEREAA
jgi:hypothetical protein